jgi:hypothetical protein
METLIGKYLSSKEYREVIQMWQGNSCPNDLLENGRTSFSPAVEICSASRPVLLGSWMFVRKNSILLQKIRLIFLATNLNVSSPMGTGFMNGSSIPTIH